MSISATEAQLDLRPYQRSALDSWEESGRRGVVVLPTGSGKTAIGVAAIVRSSGNALIVVPTVELLDQWARALRRTGGLSRDTVRVGFPSDDSGSQLPLFEWEPPGILIATYAGAARNLEELHHFSLLVFDEVHHLPAPVYRRIAECATAQSRLGLTATPERYDHAHVDLDALVGPTVYRRGVAELATFIAPHDIRRITVELEPDERAAYNAAWNEYISFVRRNRLRGPQGFQQLVKRAGRDHGAKKALEGHRQAREIALSARRKVDMVRNLLDRHARDRTIIFCQHVELAERIGIALNIPVATHHTPRSQRTEILDAFRTGEGRYLVATSILDEGIDVPDAAVGIIVSGSGQPRQFIQRLGRLIRPSLGKEALLYEIVTRDTMEERSAVRRRKGAS